MSKKLMHKNKNEEQKQKKLILPHRINHVNTRWSPIAVGWSSRATHFATTPPLTATMDPVRATSPSTATHHGPARDQEIATGESTLPLCVTEIAFSHLLPDNPPIASNTNNTSSREKNRRPLPWIARRLPATEEQKKWGGRRPCRQTAARRGKLRRPSFSRIPEGRALGKVNRRSVAFQRAMVRESEQHAESEKTPE